MTGDLAALLNESGLSIGASKVTPRHVTDVVRLVSDGTLSSAGAKRVLAEAFRSGEDVEVVVEREGLRQVSDQSALESIVEQVIAEMPGPAEQFRAGKEGALNALVGGVMKRTRGSANPQVARELLRGRLS